MPIPTDMPPEELEGLGVDPEFEEEEEEETWPEFDLGEEEPDYAEIARRKDEEMGTPYGTGFDIEQATSLLREIVALAGYFDKKGLYKHADVLTDVLKSVTAKFTKMAKANDKAKK